MSFARYTAPIPPTPMGPTISYTPSLAPVASVIVPPCVELIASDLVDGMESDLTSRR